MPEKFWKWSNNVRDSDDENGEHAVRTMFLYGTISDTTWMDDDITPRMFKDELYAGDSDVVIYLNSPGGDCIAASQIYTMLMEYPHNVTVIIDGIAASAASVIAMAGTEVIMAPTAMMFIHNPMTVAAGNSDDMQKAIEMLDEVKKSIINAYELKTGLSRTRISHLMDCDTWMNAKRAIELGFADAMLVDRTSMTEDEIPAYDFSCRKAETALFNKLQEKIRENVPETNNQPEQMPVENIDKPELKNGRSADELMARLNLIKPY